MNSEDGIKAYKAVVRQDGISLQFLDIATTELLKLGLIPMGVTSTTSDVL